MKNRSFSKLLIYLQLLRVKSWPKNFFLFVPLVFSKHVLHGDYFITAVIGFFIFSLASSAIYIVNDIADAPKDALHPVKKFRPIAGGTVSRNNATIIDAVLFIALIFFSFKMNPAFIAIMWIYIVINMCYSAFLKNIVIVDLFCIASGFMLRVLAGAYLISVSISNWLILTTMFLSLFLAVMKRRVEIAGNSNASLQRSVLKEYTINFTDQIGAMSGSCVILSYALYSVADRTVKFFGSEDLVFTSLFVIFGIFRYMYLVYKKDMGEDVVEVLFTDLPMIINVLLYIAAILYIIYFKRIIL